MTFERAFERIKGAIKPTKGKRISGHLAIQINLTDEDAHGVLYLEVTDGEVHVEPYDYHDRDAMLLVDSRDLLKILSAELPWDEAVESDRLVIEGNRSRAEEFRQFIRKHNCRTCA